MLAPSTLPPDLQVRNGELSKDAGGKAELGAASRALADLRRQRAPLASGRDWGRGGTLGQRPGRASVGAASPWRELKSGHSGCRKQRPARLSWALAQPTHVHPLQSPAAAPLGGLRLRAEPPGQGPSGVGGAASEQRGELLFIKPKGCPAGSAFKGSTDGSSQQENEPLRAPWPRGDAWKGTGRIPRQSHCGGGGGGVRVGGILEGLGAAPSLGGNKISSIIICK